MRSTSSDDPSLAVSGVSKTFVVPEERVHTLKERALHPLKRRNSTRFDALRDISFTVGRGEFFGIVGRNGSGKSTLLKCMAGIYRVDAGAVHVDGRVSTFIELGVGFNPDLAARDNVILNAVMLGLSPKEARARYDEVIDFAELREFEELKLKNYSSGMHVRLAFSVMIQVNADVLLIDEVLAVGDAAFQQKCFDEFERLRKENRTVVLVTHDMASVRRFCDRAMLIERGEVVSIGPPDEIGNQYLEMNFRRQAATGAPTAEEIAAIERHGDRKAEIIATWLEDEDGESVTAVPQGRPCTLRAVVHFHEDMPAPDVSFSLENEQQQVVFNASTEHGDRPTGTFHAGERADLSLTFTVPFAPGRYYATPTIAKAGGGVQLHDRRIRNISFIVTATQISGGIVDLPYDLTLERPGARATEVRS